MPPTDQPTRPGIATTVGDHVAALAADTRRRVAHTAAAIERLVADRWPATTFSTEIRPHGPTTWAVHVSWHDGPTDPDVRATIVTLTEPVQRSGNRVHTVRRLTDTGAALIVVQAHLRSGGRLPDYPWPARATVAEPTSVERVAAALLADTDDPVLLIGETRIPPDVAARIDDLLAVAGLIN